MRYYSKERKRRMSEALRSKDTSLKLSYVQGEWVYVSEEPNVLMRIMASSTFLRHYPFCTTTRNDGVSTVLKLPAVHEGG